MLQRTLLFLLTALLCPYSLLAQGISSLEQTRALSAALVGQWAGILEYRDYSEPATSLKRFQLPTWLQVSEATEGLLLEYTYDDGPNKVVRNRSTLILDHPVQTYRLISSDTVAETYQITGLAELKGGKGVLILQGPGVESKRAVELRTTLTVGRNLLSWLEEVRPANSQDAFVFRHRYTFTRLQPPNGSGSESKQK